MGVMLRNTEEAGRPATRRPRPREPVLRCPLQPEAGQRGEFVGGEFDPPALGVAQKHPQFDLGAVFQQLYVSLGDGQGACAC